MQLPLLGNDSSFDYRKEIASKPFRLQLLKWVGNKQKFADKIIPYFPQQINTYYEPFLGSGGILVNMAGINAVGSDVFSPLIGIFNTLKIDPEKLISWYEERWNKLHSGKKREIYEEIKASYNDNPNPADLLFISRSCYGGVIRFRQADGYISTPVGVHDPISPESFAKRVWSWNKRLEIATFLNIDYQEAMAMAKPGDLIYCDPPYSDSQAILYGAQSFSLENLFSVIRDCKSKGVNVALSIDGSKKSGVKLIDLPIPEGLFEKEVFITTGRSMLKRFQMNGGTLEKEVVKDRLLLTY